LLTEKILVVTNSYDDLHVKAVQPWVEQMGSALVRLDTDKIVTGECRLLWDYQAGDLVIRNQNDAVSLKEIDSVWYRKPFGFGQTWGFVESIADPVQRALVAAEVRDFLLALFAALSDRFWLNRPEDIELARLKPFQLHLARELDLPMPDTIITNDPEVARTFCRQGPTVFKPLAQASLKYNKRTYGVVTTLLTDRHMEQLEFIRAQPVLLQRYIDKSSELRVTYVGGEFFVARQVLAGCSVSNAVDWRSLQGTDSSTYEPGELDPDTICKIRVLLDKLKLGFAAIDFAVDQNGTLFFLEINPNGQWLGYTEGIGLPAAKSIARCLVTRTRHLEKALEVTNGRSQQ
jgi:glutathione synthase/RimK-type ligase-like ATP-grasp enzyme